MAGLFDPPNPLNTPSVGLINSLLGIQTPGSSAGIRPTLLGYGSLADALQPITQTQKRKAFFSFHFDDIMRVNVVRNAWKITHPDSPLMRSFYDSSLWESRKLDGDDALKRLIRGGVDNTSAVCVLIGSQTWLRRWVRYEIARAVIDNRGLLAVHLNSIKSHITKQADAFGFNPLDNMAVGKIQATLLSPVQYYLFEWKAKGGQLGWFRYEDYTFPVSLPRYLSDPQPGYVMRLSTGTRAYDYMTAEGHKNIGLWIDQAAQQVGR